MTSTITIITAAASIAAVMMIMLAMQLHYQRRTRELTQQVVAGLEKIEALSKASASALIRLSTAQQNMEKRLVQGLRRQQSREGRDARSLTYTQANRLIRMGADPDDLVRSCGLSQAEARLVSLIATRTQENQSAS